MHKGLGSFPPEVYDDQVTLIILDPAPGEHVPAGLVVGPSAPLTQTPFAISEDITSGLFQEASIEGHEVLVNGFGGPAAQKNRQPDFPSLELSVVQQLGSGEGEDG